MPRLDPLFQKIADLGPGSDNPHELYRDAIVELAVRLQRIEEHNRAILAAVRKDLIAITTHAPSTLAAVSLVALGDMEDK